MEREPERAKRLHENIEYAAAALRRLGFHTPSESAIIPLRVPPGMDIRKAAKGFHERGIFVNSIEYPAVPISQQRFRISIMATHTREDIDRLVNAVQEVWVETGSEIEEYANETKQSHAA